MLKEIHPVSTPTAALEMQISKDLDTSSQSVFLKAVTLIGLAAITAVAFTFAAMLLTSAITISTPWMFATAVATSLLAGCVALFYFYLELTAPLAISSNTYAAVEHTVASTPKQVSSTTTTSKAAVTTTPATPVTTKKHSNTKKLITTSTTTSTTTSITKPVAKDPLIIHYENLKGTKVIADSSVTAKCKYTQAGYVESGSFTYLDDGSGISSEKYAEGLPIHLKYIAIASHTNKSKESFFELTEEIRDVRGDGNCGYYAFATILLEKAAKDTEFREKIVSKIINTETAEISFYKRTNVKANTWVETKTSQEDINALFNSVIELFQATENIKDISSLLTMKTSLLLDKFLRSMILLDHNKLSPVVKESLELEDEQLIGNNRIELRSPLTQTRRMHACMEQSMIQALCEIFDVNIETFTFLTQTVKLQDATSEETTQIPQLIYPAKPDLPREDDPIGYMVYVGGHWILALPREFN